MDRARRCLTSAIEPTRWANAVFRIWYILRTRAEDRRWAIWLDLCIIIHTCQHWEIWNREILSGSTYTHLGERCGGRLGPRKLRGSESFLRAFLLFPGTFTNKFWIFLIIIIKAKIQHQFWTWLISRRKKSLYHCQLFINHLVGPI